jgi:hypothetical protein
MDYAQNHSADRPGSRPALLVRRPVPFPGETAGDPVDPVDPDEAEAMLSQFTGLVTELGEGIGIEDLAEGASNDFCLSFEETFVKVSIILARTMLKLLAYIGSVPSMSFGYLASLLNSCRFWQDTAGANVSIDDRRFSWCSFCISEFRCLPQCT